jgi:hypothetical protein
MDKVEFCTPSTLGTISAHAFERLPQSTVAIEAGILKKWNATLQKRYPEHIYFIYHFTLFNSSAQSELWL